MTYAYVVTNTVGAPIDVYPTYDQAYNRVRQMRRMMHAPHYKVNKVRCHNVF